MKKFPSLLSFTLILFALWYTFYSAMPQRISDLETPKEEFSTLRALTHVKAIANTPHYLGSPNHESTKQYIIDALKALGLHPEIQEGFALHLPGELGKPQNIIAKIKGTTDGKALLLMAHYDSAGHSAIGASDNGSGVATILEGISAYLSAKKTPKNDIIICFTDGEELGHLGAELFIKEHRYAKNIGIALNFEARGSGGPSYMLMETNGKNEGMIAAFGNAKVPYPVTNSLAYSIYKLLPNNTDLTVLNKKGNIEGYNFAFIDDHFDYHSANDTWENLDLNALQHQGTYLMPLLDYFANANLSNIKSDQDYVYFNAPIVNLISYPFNWIYGLLGIAVFLFCGLLWYGKVMRRISFREVAKGIAVLLAALCISAILTFGGWLLIQFLYSEYPEIQQGFPYNGHYYIGAFVFLSLGVCFRLFARIHTKDNQPSLMTASIMIWLIIAACTAVYLKGASYFIILVFFGLIALYIMIRQRMPNAILMVLLTFPALYIIAPFIEAFPIALGLKIIAVAAILTVLLFGLLVPVIGFYRRKKILGLLAFGLAFLFLIIAHFKSNFTTEHPKPNSLLYLLDTDQNTATWATYDHTLDSWTKNYITTPQDSILFYHRYPLQSKYSTEFTYTSTAPVKAIPQPVTHIQQDTLLGDRRQVTLQITPKRTIHRMEVYFENVMPSDTILANGTTFPIHPPMKKAVKKDRITYYVRDREPLVLQLNIRKEHIPKITLLESSVDLLENPVFSIPKREAYMMTKPFILNDAIVLKKTITPEYIVKAPDTTSL